MFEKCWAGKVTSIFLYQDDKKKRSRWLWKRVRCWGTVTLLYWLVVAVEHWHLHLDLLGRRQSENCVRQCTFDDREARVIEELLFLGRLRMSLQDVIGPHQQEQSIDDYTERDIVAGHQFINPSLHRSILIWECSGAKTLHRDVENKVIWRCAAEWYGPECLAATLWGSSVRYCFSVILWAGIVWVYLSSQAEGFLVDNGIPCTTTRQHVKCHLSSLFFSICPRPLLSSPLPCSSGWLLWPVSGLISRFHGHRNSCQSQYVRCYKSKPSIRCTLTRPASTR